MKNLSRYKITFQFGAITEEIEVSVLQLNFIRKDNGFWLSEHMMFLDRKDTAPRYYFVPLSLVSYPIEKVS